MADCDQQKLILGEVIPEMASTSHDLPEVLKNARLQDPQQKPTDHGSEQNEVKQHIPQLSPASASNSDTPPFRFMDLHYDARYLIYKELLELNEHGKCQPQIMAVSKEIHQEAEDIFLSVNRPIVQVGHGTVFVSGREACSYMPGQKTQWPQVLRRCHNLKFCVDTNIVPSSPSPTFHNLAPGNRWLMIGIAAGIYFHELCEFLGLDHHLKSLKVELPAPFGGLSSVMLDCYPVHLIQKDNLSFSAIGITNPIDPDGPAFIPAVTEPALEVALARAAGAMVRLFNEAISFRNRYSDMTREDFVEKYPYFVEFESCAAPLISYMFEVKRSKDAGSLEEVLLEITPGLLVYVARANIYCDSPIFHPDLRLATYKVLHGAIDVRLAKRKIKDHDK